MYKLSILQETGLLKKISKFKNFSNLVCLRCFVYSVGYIFMLMIGESELFEEDKEGEERGRKKI